MKPCFFILLLVSALLARSDTLFLRNATLIDVESGVAKPGMAVTVTNDRIATVGDTADTRVPEGSKTIDCTEKYVMPGLWDMHLHVLWEAADEFLPLLIANGVTGVRDLHTTMDLERAREMRVEIARGTRIGPRLLYSGPILDGPDPTWPGSISIKDASEARAEVQRLKTAGVDFIKVYEFLSRESYLAIVSECKKLGIPFCGHVPQTMSSIQCSELGQLTIEHLGDVLTHCGVQPGADDDASIADPDSSRTQNVRRALISAIAGNPDPGLWPSFTFRWFEREPGRIWREKMVSRGDLLSFTFVREEPRTSGPRCTFRAGFAKESSLMTFDIDSEGKVTMASSEYVFNPEKAKKAFDLFRANQTWHCPTLTVHVGSYRDPAEALRDVRCRYLSAETLRKSKYREISPASAATKRRFEQYLIVVKAMKDAAIELLAGTDAPLGSLPGFSLHNELELLHRAGLTNAEALRTATLNPARCFGLENQLGTVDTGKLADLLILEANPLEDIRNTTRIAGVVASGRYFSRSDLDQILADRERWAARQSP